MEQQRFFESRDGRLASFAASVPVRDQTGTLKNRSQDRSCLLHGPGPIQENGFSDHGGMKGILLNAFFDMYANACQRCEKYGAVRRAREAPQGSRIISQANPSRFDGRSITPRVSPPRVHQLAEAEGHPSAAGGGGVGGRKTDGNICGRACGDS